MLAEDIINLKGSGQVLLFVPFLGIVLLVLSIIKIFWVMCWCNSHSKDGGCRRHCKDTIGVELFGCISLLCRK